MDGGKNGGSHFEYPPPGSSHLQSQAARAQDSNYGQSKYLQAGHIVTGAVFSLLRSSAPREQPFAAILEGGRQKKIKNKKSCRRMQNADVGLCRPLILAFEIPGLL